MPLRTEIFKSPSKPHWVSQRERAATRANLVNVARELVAREGEAALTLGAVADAAGMARATVYGFFSGKVELLRAVTALGPVVPETPAQESETATEPAFTAVEPDSDDDEWVVFDGAAAEPEQTLQTEAPVRAEPAVPAPSERAAPDVAQPSEDTQGADNEDKPDSTEQALSEPVTEAQAESVATSEVTEPSQTQQTSAAEQAPADAAGDAQDDEPGAKIEIARPTETMADEFAVPQSAPVAFGLDEERRKLQAVHLEEIARRLILPESALKEGTDAVIARLDMRVKVLEKSVAALETRATAQEAELPRQLKPFDSRIEQFHARADASERRNLEAAAELRLAIHKLEVRLDTLSPAKHDAPAHIEADAPPSSETSALDEASQPEAEPVRSAQEGAAEGDWQGEDSKPHYLATARNLAREEARQAAERESQLAEQQQARRRRMMAAAGIAAACLAVLGGLAELRQGAHGVSAAHSHPAPAPKPVSALAPLDELSALAGRGNVEAELLVGLKYLETAGDEKSAARWLARAADSGNAVALNALGALYQQGRGVKADLAMAARLYQAAAAKGNRHAMSNLAVLYAGSDARMKDLPEAARWFERSANLGYLDAQFNLAVLYERGDGVAQSLIDAYKWYAIAAAAGDGVAKARAGAIATQLEPEELAAAEKAAAEFHAQTPDPAANSVPAITQILAAN